MRVITPMAENMELAPISGVMVVNTLEIGEKIKLVVLEFIHGLMVDVTRANGLKIIWKAWATMFGTMDDSTTDNIKMIKNMVSECILGSMVAFMKDIGSEANNMVLEPISFQKTKKLNLVCGKMANELNGLMKNKCKQSIIMDWITHRVSIMPTQTV